MGEASPGNLGTIENVKEIYTYRYIHKSLAARKLFIKQKSCNGTMLLILETKISLEFKFIITFWEIHDNTFNTIW